MTLMDHFLKGICPVMRLYINLLLKKRIQINPEINDLFRIHQFSFFLVDKWAKNFTFCVRRCYAMHVSLTSISYGLRSLEEEIHIESDCTVKQTIRAEFAVRANKFHRNSLLDLNFFNSMEFTIIGIFNFEWAFYPIATTKYPTRKRYQRKRI